MTAKIQKWGNSLALRIPKSVAQQINLSVGDGVELQVSGTELHVRPARRVYRLGDLVRKISDTNRHTETDWGYSAGREAW
jgi:antitoxin MazE